MIARTWNGLKSYKVHRYSRRENIYFRLYKSPPPPLLSYPTFDFNNLSEFVLFSPRDRTSRRYRDPKYLKFLKNLESILDEPTSAQSLQLRRWKRRDCWVTWKMYSQLTVDAFT